MVKMMMQSGRNFAHALSQTGQVEVLQQVDCVEELQGRFFGRGTVGS